MSGRVGKQDARIGLRRRDMNVAKIRTALRVEVHPQFQSLNLQIFEIDVAAQVKGVKILYANRRQHAIDLAEFLAGGRVIEFKALQFYRLRGDRGVKTPDLSANAVIRQRVLNLAGNISIDVPQAVQNQPGENQRRHGAN